MVGYTTDKAYSFKHLKYFKKPQRILLVPENLPLSNDTEYIFAL